MRHTIGGVLLAAAAALLTAPRAGADEGSSAAATRASSEDAPAASAPEAEERWSSFLPFHEHFEVAFDVGVDFRGGFALSLVPVLRF